ncbi:hypothetical protein M9Y10_004179 [Tritrichomonas musculus]|uniref:Uncharacterized protein n=1 Tax=Tritrichomonas musculus TaxID=1915356 RepID=A0ABR2JS52_9EUKA
MSSIRPLFSTYDDQDSETEEWENKFVRLRPDSIWQKPPQKIVVLTNVSISCTENDPDDVKGILVAELRGSSISLAALFKHRPSQVMNLVWRMDQNVNFSNRGNHPITISMLTKSISI